LLHWNLKWLYVLRHHEFVCILEVFVFCPIVLRLYKRLFWLDSHTAHKESQQKDKFTAPYYPQDRAVHKRAVISWWMWWLVRPATLLVDRLYIKVRRVCDYVKKTCLVILPEIVGVVICVHGVWLFKAFLCGFFILAKKLVKLEKLPYRLFLHCGNVLVWEIACWIVAEKIICLGLVIKVIIITEAVCVFIEKHIQLVIIIIGCVFFHKLIAIFFQIVVIIQRPFKIWGK